MSGSSHWGKEPDQRGNRPDAQDGPPEWLTRPVNIFAGVLLMTFFVLPLFYSVGSGVFGHSSTKSSAVMRTDCVGFDHATSEDRLKPFSDRQLRDKRDTKLRSSQTIVHFIEECPLGSCYEADLKNYVYNVGRYLGTYQHFLVQMNRVHGEAGANWVRKIYTQNIDRQIIDDLKSRIESRQVKYSDLRDRAPLARWLIERPNRPVQLCRPPKSRG